MAKLLRKLSLRTRILLLVLALLAAGVWGFAFRVTAILQRDIQQLISKQVETTIRDVAGDVERDIRMQFDSLSSVARAITPELMRNREDLQRYMQEHQALAVLFSAGVLIADAQGTVVATRPGTGALRIDSVADREYFRDVMAKGKPVVGSPVEQDQLRPVPLAVPLRDAAGMPAGALIGLVQISDPFLLGQLNDAKLGETGYFLVACSDDRMIISAPQPGRVGTRLPVKGVIRDLDRRLDEGFEGPDIAVTALGVEVLALSRRIAMTDWVVLAAVPTKEVFAPIATLNREIYLTALVISVAFVAALGFFLMHEFGRIDRAAEAMRRMTVGEQPLVEIPVTREDEIGRLKRNFNRLVAERNRLEQALLNEVGAHKQAREALEEAMKRLQTLSQHQTRAQEEERRKLAFELHEQSGQELSALKMHLQLLETQASGDQAKAHVQTARNIAGQALERVRNISIDLHPRELEEFGLYLALRAHCRQQAEAAGWVLHFQAPEGAERPGRDVELACFRVAEEALKNVLQHAEATEVWVSLDMNEDGLELSVRDDGIGFDADRRTSRAGESDLGLLAMEERVRQVAGQLRITSRPESGTEVHAFFPAPASKG